MSAVAIVGTMLVAGLCHAGWNLVAKRAATDRTLLLMGASGLVVAVLLPWGLSHLPTTSVALAVGCVVLRGTLNVLYLVGLSRSYHYFDLSLAYPLVRGIGPVVATTGAVVLLRERPAPIGVAGVVLTSLAIVAMARTGRSAPPPPGQPRSLQGALMVVLTGVTIGAYTVVDKVGVRYWDPMAYFWGVEVTGLVLVSAWLAATRRFGDLAAAVRRQPGAVAACAALIGTSYVLALHALQHSLASYIAPLREVSVLFGALLGMIVLREDHGPRRVLAAAGIAGGLICVGLAL